MGTMRIDIPGKVGAKQRHRFGKSGIVYTPKETVNYENLIKTLFVSKYPNFIPDSNPVEVRIAILVEIPASTSKANTEKMLRNELLPTKKPDVDNVFKILLDALNGIAWKDDKQVVKFSGYKIYAKLNQVSLEIIS